MHENNQNFLSRLFLKYTIETWLLFLARFVYYQLMGMKLVFEHKDL